MPKQPSKRVAAARKTAVARKKPGVAAPSSPAPTLDPALVEKLAALVAGYELSEIKIEQPGLSIRVSRHTAAPSVSAEPQPPHAAAVTPIAAAVSTPTLVAPSAPSPDDPGVLKSPMVGTSYRRPSPDAQPFVDVGQQVKAGERVMLVEAMKTFNEIVAHRTGQITAIFVEEGQPVEYGEPLMMIE